MRSIVSAFIILSLFTGCSHMKKPTAKEQPVKAEQAKAPVVKEAAPVEPPAPKTPHWGYDGLFGPELWGSLDPSFAACKDSLKQSPVDLTWRKPTAKGPINFKFKDQKLSIYDSGHFIFVDVAPGSMANIRGEVYSLLNIHFHTPSEHTIGGKSYAAEAQFTFKNTKGEEAIVSVLFKEGAKNSAMESILVSVPTKKSSINKTQIDFNPESLIPESKTYYHYMGSYTVPPCTEGVNWNVLNTPIEISKDQLTRLKAFYNNNNRPVLPLHGRQTVNY